MWYRYCFQLGFSFLKNTVRLKSLLSQFILRNMPFRLTQNIGNFEAVWLFRWGRCFLKWGLKVYVKRYLEFCKIVRDLIIPFLHWLFLLLFCIVLEWALNLYWVLFTDKNVNAPFRLVIYCPQHPISNNLEVLENWKKTPLFFHATRLNLL